MASDTLAEPTEGAHICGNGVLEADEACDDGSADADDECDDTCNWRRQEQWYLHIDDGGLFSASGCNVHPRGLAVTPDLFAVQVGCVRQMPDGVRARQAAATPDGALAGRAEWDGKVEWVVAPDGGRVYTAVGKPYLSADKAPEIRSMSGELLGTVDIPPLSEWTTVVALIPWEQDGFALELFSADTGRQRFLFYKHDDAVFEIEVIHGEEFANLDEKNLSTEASGALWGRAADQDGFYRINLMGLREQTIAKQEAPNLFRLVPDGGFSGASTIGGKLQPCNPLQESRVWRWASDGALLWTAEQCDGDALGPLGLLQITHLAVDGKGDVIVAGIGLAADGDTSVGATLLKLAGATGDRVWLTIVDPGPGYEVTTIDALQIGSDDSIFIAGRESGPLGHPITDGWIRRMHP